MSELTVEKYNEIYQQYEKLMNCISRKFFYLDKDDIESCKAIAIWQSFDNWDSSKGSFFCLLKITMTRLCQDISISKFRLKHDNRPKEIIPLKSKGYERSRSRFSYYKLKQKSEINRLEDISFDILSNVERQVLELFLQGYNQMEIFKLVFPNKSHLYHTSQRHMVYDTYNEAVEKLKLIYNRK